MKQAQRRMSFSHTASQITFGIRTHSIMHPKPCTPRLRRNKPHTTHHTSRTFNNCRIATTGSTRGGSSCTTCTGLGGGDGICGVLGTCSGAGGCGKSDVSTPTDSTMGRLAPSSSLRPPSRGADRWRSRTVLSSSSIWFSSSRIRLAEPSAMVSARARRVASSSTRC